MSPTCVSQCVSSRCSSIRMRRYPSPPSSISLLSAITEAGSLTTRTEGSSSPCSMTTSTITSSAISRTNLVPRTISKCPSSTPIRSISTTSKLCPTSFTRTSSASTLTQTSPRTSTKPICSLTRSSSAPRSLPAEKGSPWKACLRSLFNRFWETSLRPTMWHKS